MLAPQTFSAPGGHALRHVSVDPTRHPDALVVSSRTKDPVQTMCRILVILLLLVLADSDGRACSEVSTYLDCGVHQDISGIAAFLVGLAALGVMVRTFASGLRRRRIVSRAEGMESTTTMSLMLL
eukprot:TRINITY_DN44684_c0_g1_i1.p1 TRINITY_DN44684_c0_g1~~TRINITY_DN44684_c0_g1_i1.p1  ORF type:complete len:136 (-),score=10.09 TRINITY_DN44684_c0_g1_i1:198-572(-)